MYTDLYRPLHEEGYPEGSSSGTFGVEAPAVSPSPTTQSWEQVPQDLDRFLQSVRSRTCLRVARVLTRMLTHSILRRKFVPCSFTSTMKKRDCRRLSLLTFPTYCTSLTHFSYMHAASAASKTRACTALHAGHSSSPFASPFS
jgi:hypothetical protein